MLKLVLDESIEVFTCGDDFKFGGVERANGVRDKCSFSITGMRTSATAGVVWISRLYSPFDAFLHLGESFRNNWPLKLFRDALLCLCLKLGVGGGGRGGMPIVELLPTRPKRRDLGVGGARLAETQSRAAEPGNQFDLGMHPRKTLARSGLVLSIDDAVSWPSRCWKQLEMLSAEAWEIFGSLTPMQKGLSPAGTFGRNCVKR